MLKRTKTSSNRKSRTKAPLDLMRGRARGQGGQCLDNGEVCDLIHCAEPGWSEVEDKLVLDRLGEEGRKRRCGD